MYSMYKYVISVLMYQHVVYINDTNHILVHAIHVLDQAGVRLWQNSKYKIAD